MLSYESGTATFRGAPAEVENLAERLRAEGPAPVLAALRDQGVEVPVEEDGLVEAVSAALAAPIFTVEVVVSGPNGHHHHVIDAGRNAVGVRRSPLTEDRAELSGFPVVNLPGGITRIVRFRPGTAPAPDAEAVAVPTGAVVDLGSVESDARQRAWARVQPLLAEAGRPAQAESSWQLTQTHVVWTGTGGESAENSAVHLRVDEHYFVLVEEPDGLVLVPVPSITAWETMLQVLPGAEEVARPS